MRDTIYSVPSILVGSLDIFLCNTIVKSPGSLMRPMSFKSEQSTMGNYGNHPIDLNTEY
jgi:hypothetical protein